MKKQWYSLFLLPLLLGCSSNPRIDPAKEVDKYIDVSTEKIVIGIEQTYQLEVTIIEEHTIVFYSSEDENVITVDDTGLIYAVDYGSTNAIVRGGKDTYVIPVEVTEKAPDDSLQILLPREEFTIEVGDEFLLPISVKLGNEPVDALVEYEIEDESCISIENNLIKGLAAGTSKVVAKAVYEQEEVSRGFQISVY